MKSLFLIIIYFYVFTIGVLAQSKWQNISKNLSLDYPSLTVTVNTNPSPGYIFLGPTTSGTGSIIILDNDLVPVYYKVVGGGTVYDFKLQRNSKLTYNISPSYSYGLDSSGTVDKQYLTPSGYSLDVHEMQVMENGTYYDIGMDFITIDMSQYVSGGDTAAVLVANTIHHMDANDNEIWRWNSFDHYDILDVADGIDLTNHIIDWTHCNSIDIDSDGNIIISSRNFNEITKISRQTGEIIWRLGGKKNQFQFINDNRGFSRQHCARVFSNGHIALFDNGLFLIPEYSSYVEYELDEQNHTATLVRRYSRNGSLFARNKGGVQELPNGNILISWDGVPNPFISEINPEDSTVYEVMYDNYVPQYRAYRFPWKTNLFSLQYDSLDFGIVTVGNTSRTNLKIYNRRNDSAIINEVFNNDSSFYVNESLPINIAPHDSVEIEIVFEPFEEGWFTDKINFRYVTDTLLIAQQIFVQGETTPVSVIEEFNETKGYSLLQNYPNPFNPSTKIRYSLPFASNVTIRIYNSLGEYLTTIVDNNLLPGNYDVDWNASNLATGIYFYSLEAIRSGGNQIFHSVKKMMLLK